jgi:dCMP deaminase
MLINAGLSRIVYLDGYPDDLARELLLESGIEVLEHETTSHTSQEN